VALHVSKCHSSLECVTFLHFFYWLYFVLLYFFELHHLLGYSRGAWSSYRRLNPGHWSEKKKLKKKCFSSVIFIFPSKKTIKKILLPKKKKKEKRKVMVCGSLLGSHFETFLHIKLPNTWKSFWETHLLALPTKARILLCLDSL
jgi:hypothetical protein